MADFQSPVVAQRSPGSLIGSVTLPVAGLGDRMVAGQAESVGLSWSPER